MRRDFLAGRFPAARRWNTRRFLDLWSNRYRFGGLRQWRARITSVPYARVPQENHVPEARSEHQAVAKTGIRNVINKGESMKIALSAQDASPDSSVEARFGRAPWFVVYDDESETWDAVDNDQNLQAAQGAGIQSAANVVNAGCSALITGHCGPKAFTALEKAGVAVYAVDSGTVRQAMDAFKRDDLKRLDGADVDGHW